MIKQQQEKKELEQNALQNQIDSKISKQKDKEEELNSINIENKEKVITTLTNDINKKAEEKEKQE